MNGEMIDEIVNKYATQKGSLVQVLLDINLEYNYLSEEALKNVAKRLNLPLSEVFGVATFYTAFSLKPRGRHLINVCLGTACHVKGGGRILERIERSLGIKTGQTTPDRRYTVETVRCLGCCSLAPVLMVDGDVYGRLKPEKLSTILKKYA